MAKKMNQMTDDLALLYSEISSKVEVLFGGKKLMSAKQMWGHINPTVQQATLKHFNMDQAMAIFEVLATLSYYQYVKAVASAQVAKAMAGAATGGSGGGGQTGHTTATGDKKEANVVTKGKHSHAPDNMYQ